jgi:ABC-type transporter Mla subunit MlaD
MFETLLNSPVATIVAVAVAVAALAGYWFFVIPLLDDHKKLKIELDSVREENRKLQDSGQSDVNLNLESILQHNASVNKILLDLQSDIQKNPDRAFERIQEALTNLKDNGKDSSSALNELRMTLHSILEHVQNTRLRDETLHNHISELLRYMYGINEKQNQIISALLGLSKLQDNNRGIL